MRHQHAGLPREDLAELDQLAVERGIERRPESELDRPVRGLRRVCAALMSSNQGREASVSINPGRTDGPSGRRAEFPTLATPAGGEFRFTLS